MRWLDLVFRFAILPTTFVVVTSALVTQAWELLRDVFEEGEVR
jgi:hypothetical protein